MHLDTDYIYKWIISLTTSVVYCSFLRQLRTPLLRIGFHQGNDESGWRAFDRLYYRMNYWTMKVNRALYLRRNANCGFSRKLWLTVHFITGKNRSLRNNRALRSESTRLKTVMVTGQARARHRVWTEDSCK